MFYHSDRSVKRSCRSVQMLVSIFNYTLGKQRTISEANTNHHTPDHHLGAVCLPFFLDEEQHKTPAYLQGIIKSSAYPNHTDKVVYH